LSVEAAHVSETAVGKVAEPARLVGIDGGVVSVAEPEEVTDTVLIVMLPPVVLSRTE
jgi:orotidine-5'-phosphate decarboxylase